MAPLPTAEWLTRASGRRAWQLCGSGKGGQRMVAAIDAIDTGMRGGPDPAVVNDDHAFGVPLRLGECHVGGRDRARCVLIDKKWPHACERL